VPTVGFGTITVVQESPLEGVYGEWTLLKPNNLQQSYAHASLEIENAKSGNYTLLVDPPEGAIAHTSVTINGTTVQENDHPQATFTLSSGDAITITVTYVFTRVGTVSVTSQPLGLGYTLKGPNESEVKGTTPQSYQGVPEGLYSVTFDPIEGCVAPRPLSQRLVKDGRVTLSITIACEGLEDVPVQQEQTKNLQYVNAIIDGETVVFTDVPIATWFAPYVHTALKTGIVTGYRDSDGVPTGKYGPEDNISIAQLAKIAHRLSGTDETKIHVGAKNTQSQSTWAEAFFASAEVRGWLVFRNSRLDPNRNASRAEVVTTILQALDIPRMWTKGTLFSDVNFDTLYADAIETAATDGLVSGDSSGTAPTFRPDDPMNRAEIAKILSTAIEIYGEKNPDIMEESY